MKQTIIKAESIAHVENAHAQKHVVIYTSKDGTKFILNPFGGGQSTTGELQLAHDWEQNDDTLTRTYIVIID